MTKLFVIKKKFIQLKVFSLILSLNVLKRVKKILNVEKRVLNIFVFFPFFIKKLENFKRGNSKFLVLKEWLFLKHTGTSIIFVIKKFIKEELRKNKKLTIKLKSLELLEFALGSNLITFSLSVYLIQEEEIQFKLLKDLKLEKFDCNNDPIL